MKSTSYFFATTLFLLCAGLMSISAQAATIVVDSTDDALTATTGTCTLRSAVEAINNATLSGNGCTNTGANFGTNDTIKFTSSLAGATIPVTANGHIEIIKDMTIDALDSNGNPQNIVLDGNGANRILHIRSAEEFFAAKGLIFKNGNSVCSYGGCDGGAIKMEGQFSFYDLIIDRCTFLNNLSNRGGALSSNSNVIVKSSTFIDNSATGYYGSLVGGAITALTASISSSTFSGNSAGEGGAISTRDATNVDTSTFNNNEAVSSGAIAADTIKISNSTFSNNKANNGSCGAISVSSTATLSNSTFSNNKADFSGGAICASLGLDARHLTLVNNSVRDHDGAAIRLRASYGVATLHNSLIVGDDTTVASGHCSGAGTFFGSYNVEWQNKKNTTTCGSLNPVTVPATITQLSQIVSTLANNGGATWTQALPTGSPAIGAADATVNGTSQMLGSSGDWVDATLDQRGVVRKAVTVPRDVGAFETNDGTNVVDVSSDVIEYYHQDLDHYFMTLNSEEIKDLDSGKHQGWARTGYKFKAYKASPVGTTPVCRYYMKPEFGDSHFYSASEQECAEVGERFSHSWVFESRNVFSIKLPNTATGACPSGTKSVWRFFNETKTNHRYTTDPTIRDTLRATPGWIAEGYGTDGVVMCAEQ